LTNKQDLTEWWKMAIKKKSIAKNIEFQVFKTQLDEKPPLPQIQEDTLSPPQILGC